MNLFIYLLPIITNTNYQNALENMKKYLLIFILLYAWNGFAQEAQLGIIAKVEENKIVIRWMPLDYQTWQLGNANGYLLERKTISRNNIKIDESAILLTKKPLKPLKEDFWTRFGKTNKFAEVVGKLLFQEPSSDTTTQNLQFALSMLMSNMSVGISNGMGMLFEDKTINKGEIYEYSVKILESSISAKTIVNTTQKTILLPPRNIYAEFSDSTVFIRWQVTDSLLHSAFVVERSDDGGVSFKSIDANPILISTEPDSLDRVFGAKSNKLPRFYQNYYYRVKAITPFGELSQASAIVKIMGYRDKLPLPKVSHQFLPQKGVLINWTFPESIQNEMLGFGIYRSAKLDQKYELLTKKRITRNVRMFVDSLPLSEGYYRVVAIDWAGKEHTSYPEFVQIDDTIPPIKPLIKIKRVNEKSVVTLKWSANKESDFQGYSIFRGDNPKQEFSIISKEISKDTVLTDTLSLVLLNKKVFYTIIAYDKRLNASIHSDTIIIKRPDIIPPSSPNFTSFEVSDSTIHLKWVNSFSEDVVYTVLLRRAFHDSIACLVHGFRNNFAENKSNETATETSFSDKTAEDNITYEYNLVAYDESGLASKPTAIQLSKLFTGVRNAISPLTFEFDTTARTIKINWLVPKQKVRKYILYRKKGKNEYMSVYKQFEGKYGSFIDLNAESNITYYYRLMAILEDGSETKLSEIFTAKMPDEH